MALCQGPSEDASLNSFNIFVFIMQLLHFLSYNYDLSDISKSPKSYHALYLGILIVKVYFYFIICTAPEQPDDSSRDKEQEERRRLVKEHQNQLQRVRNECESKVKDASAKAKADISLQMENALKEARKEWEEEQHDVR